MPTARMSFSRHNDDPSIDDHLPELCGREDRDDADRCMSVFLRVQRLRNDAAAEGRRLLRLLLLGRRAMSARAIGPVARMPSMLTIGGRHQLAASHVFYFVPNGLEELRCVRAYRRYGSPNL
jgi:hypothetical protein